jgi:hypothetical protein
VTAPFSCQAFSAEEAVQIQRMIVTPGAQLRCPRCGGELTSEMPMAGGHSIAAVWEFRCEACRRSLIARDLPVLG